MESTETALDSIQAKGRCAVEGPEQTFDDWKDDQNETGSTTSQAHDDSSDPISELGDLRDFVAAAIGHPGEKRERKRPRERSHEYLPVGIPTFSNGLTTFSYQQALRNRISESKLRQGGDYDIEKYTPTFVHDCLMFPGSLASLLDKVSVLDVLPKMTPALLPGYRATTCCETGEPRLVKSDTATDYVNGLLIFGEGKIGRRRIQEHYRLNARRKKIFVGADVVATVPACDRRFASERWQLHRRRFEAHAWLSRSGPCNVHPLICPDLPPWTLETYLEDFNSDNNGDSESLRIDPSAYGIEEDGGVSVPQSINQSRSASPEREVVWAGCGDILYHRLEEGWSGW